METIEDTQGKVIIWAPHTDKIDQIIECLRRAYSDKDIVRYDGSTAKKDRMDMVDRFQDGAARFFVGNPASGGTGLTLSAAETAIYYSNSFNLEHRIQSEDRNHRIGTTSKVTYYDIEAVDTIDHIIIQSNQAKQKLADIITGDSK
jgi:SNF2 family DNA or RNA helicase